MEVLPASPRLLKEFVELPYRLYARDPHWVPPLRRDEYRRLSPRENPFLEHADMQLWVARAGGQTTGRIAAIVDRAHNETHGERAGWFGFFEAADAATARALLETVERHSAAGSTIVRGPVNPSLNESAGLLIEGFDEDPFLLMPYNPPAYGSYIEQAGYRKAKDLFAWTLDPRGALGARMLKLADRVAARNRIRVRTMEMEHFERDLSILQRIYTAAWEQNWGFVAPTDAEMRQLAVDLRPVLDPRLMLFAEVDGQPAGFALAIPDANQLLKRMNGRLFPFGIMHYLRRRSIMDQVRVPLLGVVPSMQKLGLYPVLVAELFRRAQASGYTRAELGWTLEDNTEINAGIAASGAKRYKTYRIFEKDLVRIGN